MSISTYSNPDCAPSLADLLSLRHRTALVVGGSGLLGSEISFVLAELGADVLIASRNLERCHDCAARVVRRYPGATARGLSVDITIPSQIDSLKEQVQSITKGKLDILVMSAWSGKQTAFPDVTDENWNYDIEVTLNGVFRTIRAMFPLLSAARGNILCIASMYGHISPDYRIYEGQGFANPPSYGAAKAGVIQLTKYLASFAAPYSVRANCLSPGPFPYVSRQTEQPDFINRLCAKNPLDRIGKPHELKGAVALLCSDAGSYMTGQNICVDGGWAIW